MRDEFDTLFVAMLTDAKAEELVEEVEYFPRQIQCLKLKAVEAGKERPSDRDAALEVLRGVSKLFKQLQQAIRSDEDNISEDIKALWRNLKPTFANAVESFPAAPSHVTDEEPAATEQLEQSVAGTHEHGLQHVGSKDFTCNACLKQFLSANSHECAGCGYDECDECFDAAVAAAAES